jgi:iron complex outermembrane receptor protein
MSMGMRSAKAALLAGAVEIAIFGSDGSMAESQVDAAKATVETVTVTAQRRTEAAADVPMSVTALSTTDLARDNATRFEDYVDQVPGMQLIESSPVTNQLVLRGVTIGANSINSSVAVYLDETPYTSEGRFANAGIAPNLDTFDIQRVEVLRGPQGTLYGSLALAGIMKYVTNEPDPSEFTASGQIGWNSVFSGSNGYDLHGVVNVPLSDYLALRVVGYDSFYPGYIDDPSRALKSINGTHVMGGRTSLLYQPTGNFSIRLNILYQDIYSSNPNSFDVNPGTLTPVYGQFTQERLIPQPSQTKNELYNLTAKRDVGFASLLSSTSYSYTPLNQTVDTTAVFSALTAPFGTALVGKAPVTNFTQEIRASSPSGDTPLQWLVGGYYNREFTKHYEQIFYIDPATDSLLFNSPVNLATYHIEPTYREYAAFGNLDYFIVPSFDIGAGGRYSSNNQSYRQISTGTLSGTTNDLTLSSGSVFTYSADAGWHWTKETMAYGRIATGYAPGGPNDVLPGSTLPEKYDASKTVNYEIGIKSRLFDDELSAEIAVFRINWDSIQIESVVGSLSGITNGGRAQSEGTEWDFGYVPVAGLTLKFNGAYTDAYLAQALPLPSIGAAGARLPYVPLWSTNVSANYEHPLVDDYAANVGINWHYSGGRYADFPNLGPRQNLPSYDMIDVRAGIETEGWTLSLFVKNAANELVISSISPNTLLGGLGVQTASVFTPRTIGVELSAKY